MEVICGKLSLGGGKPSLLHMRYLFCGLRCLLFGTLLSSTILGSQILLAPPKIKAYLELRRFPNVEDVREANAALKDIQKEEFRK
jgi:hypothetical protein